jgi:hypothetical protein
MSRSQENNLDEQQETLSELQAGATFHSTAPPAVQPFLYDDKDDSTVHQRSIAKSFIVHGKQIRLLFAMSIGAGAEFHEIWMKPPFNETKKKVEPTKKELVSEVLRRAHFIGKVDYKKFLSQGKPHPFALSRNASPRPGQWTTTRLLQWLELHQLPELHEKDTSFLRMRIGEFRNQLRESQADARVEASNNVNFWQRKGWANLGARCRFVNVLISDEMRTHFMARDSPLLSRTEFDAQRTESATKSAWQRLADSYNDELVTYESAKLGEGWGHWYEDAHDLSWGELHKFACPKMIDGRDMKAKFQEMNNVVGGMFEPIALGKGLRRIAQRWTSIPNAHSMLIRT